MWRILQQETPSDYVLGTGESRTIREFLDEAFSYVDLDWRDYVELDPNEILVIAKDSGSLAPVLSDCILQVFLQLLRSVPSRPAARRC